MKTKYLAFAALASLMLASCSNEEDFAPQTGNAPITVTAGVSNLATRSGYEGTSVLPETFYFTVKQDAADETSKYNYTNVLMTKGTDNSYTPDREMLWMDDDSRTPFVSAYTTKETTFTVLADQSTEGGSAVNASDLLGAVKKADATSNDVSITNNTISIKFRHLLCKLDLTYKWNGEVASATSKSIDGVTIGGMNTKVTLNTAEATVSDESTIGDIKAYVSEITDESVDGGYMSEVIFAPSTAAPQVAITTTVDGVLRTFTATLTAPTDGFTSGNRYSATLTIGKDMATVSAVSVSAFTGAESNLADGETEQTTSLVLDATSMAAEDLKNSVVAALFASTSTHGLDITMAADAEAAMFTAIRRALIDTDYVADGSVALTLRGVTAVPDHSENAAEGNIIFGNVIADENGEYLDEYEYVTGLKSITLPDATSIGENAFCSCGNLTEVIAPKVQTVGESAFKSTGIVSVELPEATTIGDFAFQSCYKMTTIKLPKVYSLGDRALRVTQHDVEQTIYLTSDADITVHERCFYYPDTNSKYLAEKVNLVLNANKQEQVSGNTWTTSSGVSFTFKSISFTE